MSLPSNLTLAFSLAVSVSALMSLAANGQLAPNSVRPRTPNETPAPKVVFIGDDLTLNWTSGFAANPNWINKGVPAPPYLYLYWPGSSAGILARFQTDVVDLHPNLVHIMMGTVDEDNNDDANYQYTSPDFLSNLNQMVEQAQAAKIGVVLGIEPGAGLQLNTIVATYGAIHNIPVINYTTFPPTTPDVYAAMTQLAEATINTQNQTLEGGYLQNVEQPNPNEGGNVPPNQNTVNCGAILQFTPYGYYNQPGVYPFLNTNFFTGATGTWASSNPLVMSVSQAGLAYGLSSGTAIITYTSPSGIKFSEWIMYVGI
jgi:hypothetical protein